MSFGDQARFRFRNARIGQIAASPLINRIVNRADEGLVISRESQRRVVPSVSTKGALGPKG